MWIVVVPCRATIWLATARCLVDRDRVAAVDRVRVGVGAAGGGVHPDHVSRGVDERPTGVAGLEGGVRREQAGELLGAVRVVVSDDRLPEPDDLPRRAARGAADAARVPEGRDGVAELHAARMAERGGLEARGVQALDHGDVAVQRVADDLGLVGAAVVDVGDADRGRAADHVVVREDHARAREDDARCLPRRRPGSRGSCRCRRSRRMVVVGVLCDAALAPAIAASASAVASGCGEGAADAHEAQFTRPTLEGLENAVRAAGDR